MTPFRATFAVALIVMALFVAVGSSVKIARAADISFPFWGPILSCTGDGVGMGQCTNLCDLLSTGQRAVYFGLTIALVILAPAFLIWGGILLIISSGATERIEKGRSLIRSTIIGLLLLMSSWLIVNTFFYFAAKFMTVDAQQITWSSISCSVTPQPAK